MPDKLPDPQPRDLTELEVVEQFHNFLQGRFPNGVTVGPFRKLTPDQAFTVIWFLQEVSHLIRDHYEMCSYCGQIYDSDSGGHYNGRRGKHYCSVMCEGNNA